MLGYWGLESMKSHGKGTQERGKFQKYYDGVQEFIKEHTRIEAMLGSGKERKGIVESRAQRLWS